MIKMIKKPLVFRGNIKNIDFKVPRATLFFLLMVLVMPIMVQAWEFDNTKSYDSKDRSITVSNSFLQIIDLDAIAKVTPTTPHVNYVIRGKDRLVAEFTIESYLTYKEKVWDGMKFIDKNTGKEIQRDFKIRYKELEPYKYPNYVEECTDTKEINKTDGSTIWNCKYIYAPITRLQKVWKDLDTNADLPKGFIEIGIFTDVEPNDNIEFIPTWFGISMPEYATWTDSFNVGLETYWDFNSTTNLINPAINNITYRQGTAIYNGSDCLIGNCSHVSANNNFKILSNQAFDMNFKNNFTLNYWIKVYDNGESANPFWFGAEAAENMGMDSPPAIYASTGITGVPSSNLATLVYKNWTMITITRNQDILGGNMTIYVDGKQKNTGTASKLNNSIADWYLGSHVNSGLSFDLNGAFDETSYYSRTLSPLEVLDLYNGGLGLSYSVTASIQSSLNVSLIYPPNKTISNLTAHYFNSSATTLNGNISNATLHLWKTATELTNFTAIAGLETEAYINMSLDLTDGSWWWNVEYCGMNSSNLAQCVFNNTNNTLTIDTIAPSTRIFHPLNASYNYLVSAMNFTLTEINKGTCRFDNMTLNQTTSCTLNMTGNSSHQGSNRWILWANDTAGNLNGTSVDFYVDSLYPLINFTAPTPTNGTNSSSPNFTVAVEASDPSFSNVTFYLYNSTHDLINESANASIRGWCYQESTNVSTTCGGLATGNYSYCIGAGCVNWQNIIDGDWTTGADLIDSGTGTIYINYTKPLGAMNSSLWQVRDSVGYANLTIPKECWEASNETLAFRLYGVGLTTQESFDCFNGTGFKDTLRGGAGITIYEEAMVWNLTYAQRYYNLSTDSYYYYVNATDAFNNQNRTETRVINIDTELPAVFVYEPKSFGLIYLNQNASINFSAVDRVGNLDGCWFNYNGTNFTIPCATNNTFLLNKQNYLTLFANHTAGSEYNSTTHYWNYTAFISNYSFVGLTYSGFSSLFSINFSLDSSAFTGINMLLSYNGTNYTMTSSDAGDDKRYTYTLSVPTTTTEVNRSFFYTFELTNASGTTTLETKPFNQTIKSFLIDNCSTNINPILNMRMIDEETLLAINGTIEVNVHLYSQSTNELVNSYNDTFNYDNNFSEVATICTSNFSGAFKMAYTIRHYGNQSTYFKKFRVVQNQTITNQTMPVNLTLYNLLFSSGYSFVIKARESNPTTNLLVEAYKQYIGLDNYSLVESSVTDADGNTILHLTPSSVNYKFIVSYEGQLISVQEKQQVICNNLATLDCQTTLNLAGAIGGIPDYTSFGNIVGAYKFNTTSQVFEFSFVSSDGNPHRVNVWVVKNDAFGNTTIYNGTYTGTAGTLSTVIPPAYFNTTIMSYLEVDGQPVSRTHFSNYPKQNWYGADVILELLMFSSLVLLLIAHPIMIVIGAIFGLVFSVSLILVTDGSFSGIVASLIYFIVAGGIIIWQIGKRL